MTRRQNKTVSKPADDLRKRWQGYALDVAVLMRLAGWRIEIGEPVPGDEAFAQITITPAIRFARISLCYGWEKMTPEEQRKTTVHELIHIHLEDAAAAVQALEGPLGSAVYGVAYAAFQRPFEVAIEQLAQLIAPSMPLPGAPP